jgi:hypothetical protein
MNVYHLVALAVAFSGSYWAARFAVRHCLRQQIDIVIRKKDGTKKRVRIRKGKNPHLDALLAIEASSRRRAI